MFFQYKRVCFCHIPVIQLMTNLYAITSIASMMNIIVQNFFLLKIKNYNFHDKVKVTVTKGNKCTYLNTKFMTDR